MLEIVQAGGWLMAPILLCSIAAMAITVERFWTLQRKRVAPPGLVLQVWEWTRAGSLTPDRLAQLRAGSPLGRVLSAGLANRHLQRERVQESIEDEGRQVVHELERYLSTLGTVASVTPLLGLLGTVIGMIKVFSVITVQGVGQPGVLAGGISEALITTAAGLTVAIPTLILYRYFRGRVNALVMAMEQEVLKMMAALQDVSERRASEARAATVSSSQEMRMRAARVGRVRA
ncbi:MAG: MotA/TolQ/ExbB proton channel family protein [Gammaproteobacteria bacterium]